VHIGQWEAAERVHNAWLRTIEEGVHTYDIFEEGISKQKVGTKEFAQAVIARMGQKPEKLAAVSYAGAQEKRKDWAPTVRSTEVLMIGVDLYIGSKGVTPQALGDKVKEISHEGLTLRMIDNRGVIVYPGGMSETFLTDSYRCRFEAAGAVVTHAQVAGLYQKMAAAGYDIVKTESLRTFDGKPGFTLAQGQ
jgi:isocitrate dehydrogenase